MKTLKTDTLLTKIYPERKTMGQQAAKHAAAAIRMILETKEFANVIFAAAPSQNEMLEQLMLEDIDFSRINAFHMDEYVGLSISQPQSFASYLTEHLFAKADFHAVHFVPATEEISTACQAYSRLIQENPPDLVCMGIGENGHIAFNDPPVADFHDPEIIKPVELDDICRMQQVHDKCFPTLEDVPKYALTLTVPTLMSASYLVCTVPGPTKAAAVKAMLTGPISETCPATILRHHKNAVMFLDQDSAEQLEDIV